MTARAFLVRGLLAGLFAGIAAFAVGYFVAEPQIQTAINYEESHEDASATHSHSDSASGESEEAEAGHHHDEGGTVVSRHNQRTWGLLTGTLAIGLALGGIVALVAAGVVGRIGALSPGQSTALVTLLGFLAFILVPFLKYPANPPAVGNADTIGARTTEYFVFLLISVVVAVGATILALRVRDSHGTYTGVLVGVGTYLVVMVVAGVLMPTVNEVGDFPADTLWYFRRDSLITSASMWAVLGVALTGLVGRLYSREQSIAQRRALAASL
jgi:predicted cobalt transporter CbtA